MAVLCATSDTTILKMLKINLQLIFSNAPAKTPLWGPYGQSGTSLSSAFSKKMIYFTNV